MNNFELWSEKMDEFIEMYESQKIVAINAAEVCKSSN